MVLDNLTSKRTLTTLMLCIGLVQIAGYYLAGMLASPDGGMAVPQPDTLLYCQAARRIVEGHPFSFSAGTAVSTGTTSVLYPFILAIPYALGATGDSLFMAGFWFNALFYLVFLFGWSQAIWKWLDHPWARLTAALLMAISGHPAFSAAAQSDMGCWMAMSALLAWGLAVNKPGLYGPVLILAPWIRPEGMICVVALGLVLIIRLFLRRGIKIPPPDRIEWAILIVALTSTLGVFFLNFMLTGHAQFSSVANKGYFAQLPFAKAIYTTAGDFWCLTKEVVLGLSPKIPRDFYSIPFLGGALFLVGLFCYPWKSEEHSATLPVFLLASLGGFATVAQSGWQNTNFDRYLSWMLPLLSLFTAYGAHMVTIHLPRQALKGLLLLLLLAGTSFNGIGLWATYHLAAKQTTREYLFCSKEVAPVLSGNDSLGVAGLCGEAYAFSPRRVANLGGIYSPEFLGRPGEAHWIEILSNEPQTRFDYWLVGKEIVFPLNKVSKEVLMGPDGMQLRKADWSSFDAAQHTPAPCQNSIMISKIDIAHEKSEDSAEYEIIDRYNRPPLPAFVRVGKLNGKPIIEGGRLLTDGDAMTLPAQPGKDLTVVMRTGSHVKLTDPCELSPNTQVYMFNNPITLKAFIDEEPVGSFACSLTTNDFSDVSFTIPGAFITRTPCRLKLLGGHLAYGYWFFQ